MVHPDAVGNLVLRVLGATAVERRGLAVALGSRERVTLAVLAFAHPRAVSVDRVADALWPDRERPRTHRQVVHNVISTIRRLLGVSAVLTESGPSYRLGGDWTIDVAAFAAATERARRARAAGDHRSERVHLRQALAWCGRDAFTELDDSPAVIGRRTSLLQARLTAEEDLVFAELDEGEPLVALARASELVAAEPYREVRWSLVALAAYRSGQRGAALATLARARAVLREELGIEPGPALVRLERMALLDDPRLLAHASRQALGTDGPATAAQDVDDRPVADTATIEDRWLPPGDDPVEAIDALSTAATSAGEAGLFDDAAALLESASRIAEQAFGAHDERTLRLCLAWAEQQRRAGTPGYRDLLWDVLARADGRSDSLFALATAALCKLGPATEAGGETDGALVAAIERVARECSDTAARARCVGEATLYFTMKGEADRCRQYFDDALALARGVGDPDLLISALGNAYLCLPHPQDLAQRTDLAIEMLVVAERLGGADAILEALHFVFAVQLQNADPLLRTTMARQSMMARTVGSTARRWMAGYQETCLRWFEGRLDEAEALARRTLEIAPVAPSRALSSYRVAMLGIRAAEGRVSEMTADFDDAVEAFPGMPAWRAMRAWVAAGRGDHAVVRQDVDALDAGHGLAADMAWSGAAMLLGRAVALIGDVDRSRPVYELIHPYAGQYTWMGSTSTGPFDLALAELALVLGDRTAAAGHIDGLARGVDRTGAVLFCPDLERLRASL